MQYQINNIALERIQDASGECPLVAFIKRGAGSNGGDKEERLTQSASAVSYFD